MLVDHGSYGLNAVELFAFRASLVDQLLQGSCLFGIILRVETPVDPCKEIRAFSR
jgi:hypothetical protein